MADAQALREALAGARKRLRLGGIEDTDIEAEVLLRHALGGISRADLYRRLNEPTGANDLARLEALLARRLAHEPSAYITGEREFYGLDFRVTPDVLIPRPETELLVDAAIALCRGGPIVDTARAATHARPESDSIANLQRASRLVIVDVGTGSGAIAVALAKHLPGAEVYATDVSYAALALANENAHRHDVERRVAFRHGDLLAPVSLRADLIVANLPYVTTNDCARLAPEVRDHEPRAALEGGADGLDVIRCLLQQAPRYQHRGGALLIEFGIGQADALLDAAREALPGASLDVLSDLAGKPRVLVALTPA